jgi:hypothetical protein
VTLDEASGLLPVGADLERNALVLADSVWSCPKSFSPRRWIAQAAGTPSPPAAACSRASAKLSKFGVALVAIRPAALAE